MIILQVHTLAEQQNVLRSEELSTLLHFYHDQGSLMYWGSFVGGQTMRLENTVKVDTTWLIEAATNLLVPTHKDVPVSSYYNIHTPCTRSG